MGMYDAYTYDDILPWDEHGNREFATGTVLAAGTHEETGRIHVWDVRRGPIGGEVIVDTREEADAELRRIYPSRHLQSKTADLADPPGSG